MKKDGLFQTNLLLGKIPAGEFQFAALEPP